MSYIFRLHEEGVNTLNGWDTSSRYGKDVINQIEDPNGESSTREITSIPSPFARIDLVKTAFAKVVDIARRTKTLDGDTIHHKMVSDCFDVGQLFFEFDKHSKLEIIVWDKRNDLNELLNSSNQAHRQLGETYRIYIEQDGGTYNFDKMNRLYLLNYVGDDQGTSEINIIGGTSPATLFFSSANSLGYISRNITFSNNDNPFDDKFCPLHKRDTAYIKYWWALRKSIPNFARLFKEVDDYLEECYKHVDDKTKAVLRAVTKADLDALSDIDAEGGANHPVEVLNEIKLKQQKNIPINIEIESGFVIDSEHRIGGFLPLVLPTDNYTHPTIYTKTSRWIKETKVPFIDYADIKNRVLPAEGSKYPYLTISDFLTDTIVRMPFEINKESFFDGNINRTDGKSYLLPLTNLFFEFFSTEDLITNKKIKDGKKMFEFNNNSGGITVVLRIPIKGGKYIEYRRTYFEGIDPNIEEANQGKMIGGGKGNETMDKYLGLGVMPLVKFPENVKKHYRVAVFDLDSIASGERNVQLSFWNAGKPMTEQAHSIRAPKTIDNARSSVEAYSITENFDRIGVKVGDVCCAIIPKFAKENIKENKEFTFAVDFGTTNTHIEYTIDGGDPETFNILKYEKQMHKFHKSNFDPDIEMAYGDNFIPEEIADDTQFTFPMRTSFSEYHGINYDKSPLSLVDGNIPFYYEKNEFPKFNELKTDIKWGGVPSKLVRLYLENLFILMRNKVVLNEGNLDRTKIIWFYPASMEPGRVSKFKEEWDKCYKEYFGLKAKENVISISESAAPYEYYRMKKGAKREVVTIDIGGGTTDVYVVENTIPKMLMSFRFASEAIFGGDPDNNGFIKLYKESFVDVLRSNNLNELTKVLSQIASNPKNKNKSADIIAFFFSLAKNTTVKDNDSLNFLEQLSSNDQLRYVFILFYGAILYFIAKTMKAKGLNKPLTLAFSGNGSKTLQVLSGSDELKSRFAKLIFDGVYENTDGKISIILEENPKKATCKGGILNPEKQEYDTIDELKSTFIGNNFDIASTNTIKYSDISKQMKADIIQSVSDFVDFMYKLHSDNNNFFTRYLNADPRILKMVKDICTDKVELSQSLEDRLDKKMDSLEDNDNVVSETLFFYPLVGVLQEIAREISKLTKE